MDIWGISLFNLEPVNLPKWLDQILTQQSGFQHIVTINPEFLLLARENKAFHKVLIDADYRLMDGVGVGLAYFLRGASAPKRITGVDLIQQIFSISQERKLKIFFALRKGGLSTYQDIKRVLSSIYPHLQIDGMDIDPEEKVTLPSMYQINQYSVVICNFGAPEQEFFLAQFREQPGMIKLAIGVGGALDYFTGKVKRAPRLFRYLGLEWLWRLFLQPQRFRRIFRAVIIFPIRLIFGKINL